MGQDPRFQKVDQERSQDSRFGKVDGGEIKRVIEGDPEPPPDVHGPWVTVMTRNLCFGTSFAPVLKAGSLKDAMVAVGAAFNEALATDFPGRASAWADEIELARPDLIGLQEAVVWQTLPLYGDPPPPSTKIDLVELLLMELRRRGLDYFEVVHQVGQELQFPGMIDGGVALIRLTQREVILARETALTLTNEQGGTYKAAARLTMFEARIRLPWAWAFVDATIAGRTFRFATTHLDPDDGHLQMNQADEFLAGPAQTSLPIVWVGDFNSDAERQIPPGKPPGKPPATPTYQHIIASGFLDAWKARNAGQPGFTCCQGPDLMNAMSSLEERVDLVLTRGRIGVVNASIVGGDPSNRLSSGLWPSDHAGVVATLEL